MSDRSRRHPAQPTRVSAPHVLLLAPGYNQPRAHFDLLADGHGSVRGLRAHGIECISFPQHDERLGVRIERFAEAVEVVRKAQPGRLTLLGYSLGGLVVRGYLGAYPQRAEHIGGAITIATPHWGVRTFATEHVARVLRVPDHAMEDMELNSGFLRWLNGTSGHWTTDRYGGAILDLDAEPWIVPQHVRILSVVGSVPRYRENDGLVWCDSATLGSRIPAHFIIGPTCNHINLMGHFDPSMLLAKGFVRNDRVWPLTLRAGLRFCGVAPRDRATDPANE